MNTIKNYYLISPTGIIVGTLAAGFICRDYEKNIIEIYKDEGSYEGYMFAIPINWSLVPVESIKVV